MASGSLVLFESGDVEIFSFSRLSTTEEIARITRMSLDQRFESAAADVKALTKRPSDDELLELYALYKQGSVGDNNTAKPGLLDLKAKAKWNAWDGKRGTSQDAAKEAYIAVAEKLIAKYK